MTDDLVNRLRSMEVFWMDGGISPVAYAAADRIEELEKENEMLRKDRANMKAAAKKALKNATEMDNWHRYGEGYEVLIALVEDMIKDKGDE